MRSRRRGRTHRARPGGRRRGEANHRGVGEDSRVAARRRRAERIRRRDFSSRRGATERTGKGKKCLSSLISESSRQALGDPPCVRARRHDEHARRARGRSTERVGGVFGPPAPVVTAAGPACRERAMKGRDTGQSTRVRASARLFATGRASRSLDRSRGTKSRRGVPSARTSDGSRAGGRPRSACAPEGAVRTHSWVRPGRRGRVTRGRAQWAARALSDDQHCFTREKGNFSLKKRCEKDRDVPKKLSR